MTKQEFIDTRSYIKMNDKGYSYLEENANHVLDEFIYADKEWKDEVLGVKTSNVTLDNVTTNPLVRQCHLIVYLLSPL